MNISEWLADWYKSECNGDWEHTYGIQIGTIDNPGWSLRVDLLETRYEGKKMSMKVLNSDEDWYDVTSNGEFFTAVGDASKLQLLITLFKEFIEK
ncbi:immunity 53 family protein [Pedobacter heparinus]|uniref:immunity 53 family protein n=1 Tax=Pedobacter heparinus TaxID=984 RepID=UPI00292DC69E|nr:immunity 53 family protein [Pedobacter heparinus]